MSHDSHSNGHHDAVDSWHRHSAAEGEPQHEHGARVQPGKIAVIGFVHVVLFIGAVIAVILYFNYTITRARSEITETTEPADEWYAYDNDAKAFNSSYGIDAAGEDARIPVLVKGEAGVRDAASIVVEQYKNRNR